MPNNVDKYYPVQGTNKFQTVSFPITRAFRVDFGAATTHTATMESFPKGSLILGFSGRVVEAMEAAGAATVQFGFVGSQMLSSALASGTMVADYIVRPSSTAVKIPHVLAADDTFDIVVATTNLSAGKVDFFVTYIPIPLFGVGLSTKEFRQWVTT